MITRQRQVLFILITYFVFFLLIAPQESLPSPYYEGKKITIVVGVGPGGGYDRMARLLQKHLPRYIPGKPVIVVENMPGAASILAANRVYTLAKPDGLTIGAPQRGMPVAQLLKVDGVKFDVTKFEWVGSTAVESTVLCMRTDLPYKTFADLQKAKTQLMIGGTGLGESSTHFMTLLKEFFGLNAKQIFYPSSSDVMLAVERKEVDGRPGSFSALKPYIDRGVLIPLIRGRASVPESASLPVDEELVTDKKAKIFMAMRSSVELIGRPYVAPPKTPPAVMKILQEAFAKVVKDAEFVTEAKRNMMDVQYTSADECRTILNGLFNQPEAIIKEFSKYINF
jgi:tripartite-type tricarboxylate transporter receptor subunit TctC